MTISRKLFTGFGIATAITLMTGGLAIRNVETLGDCVQELGGHSGRLLYLSGNLNSLTNEMLATTKGILVDAVLKDSDSLHTDKAHYDNTFQKLQADLQEMLANSSNPRVRESLTKMDGLLASLYQTNTVFYEHAVKSDIGDTQSLYKEKLLPLANQLSETGDAIAQRENEAVSTRAAKAIGIVVPARYASIFMICLSLVVGVLVVSSVRSISATLRNNIDELREGAEQVANAASQVSSSSQSLAQGSSEQAASLEETSASSEEINSMARKNLDNSRATAQLLAASHQKVTLANQHLDEMEISMTAISESSDKISKIIKVIDDIAFQTNILALNAAVEAARAGESGMGFAVVADEVRSLAQRSAQAAKDTALLIEDSIARSAEGKHKVEQVASTIRAVTADSARIKVMVDEVSLGSEEQSKGISQIGKAISQMEQVTQTTAANAEESAAAAEQLNSQSETMRDVVDRLQALVDDGADLSSSIRRPPPKVRLPAAVKPRMPQRSPVSTPVSMPVAQRSAPIEEFPMEESFQAF